ncbi:MAG: hypothetical protein Q9169_004289 [Polycauliona sp. 2 TL-2023]
MPCANCVKARTQCVSAALAPRQRKRRFPERVLLDRLRGYEKLLRQNGISFDSLQPAPNIDSPDTTNADDPNDELVEEVASELSTSAITPKDDRAHRAKNVYHYLNRPFRGSNDDSDSSDDDLREQAVKRAWDQDAGDDHHLLFGRSASSVSLYTLHPDPVQIFRLWQIYTMNVNPLLKVTHIPTLQGRVIEAASNVTNIDPSLEALMFSIYCIAILSIGSEDASPQSLSPMLGVVIRIAQRMGIHSEFVLADYTPFEAEMRRRLWWSLILFDKRMGELGNSRISTLDPTWDCQIPLNVSDTDLWPEMKSRPVSRKEPSDAVFAVVRSELGDYLRHTSFHLKFSNPALIPLAKNGFLDIGQLVKLEQTLEDRYFGNLNHENPLHYMTILTTQAQLSKYYLMVHNVNSSNSSTQPSEQHHDAAISSAIKLLEYDTKLMTSPLMQGFVWLNQMYFPFPGYYQISQELKRKPFTPQAQKAWDAVSNNWDAWFNIHFSSDSPIFKLLPKPILQAWEAYRTSSDPSGQAMETPRIIVSIKETLARVAEDEIMKAAGLVDIPTDLGANAMATSMPSDFADYNHSVGLETQGTQLWPVPGISSTTDLSTPIPLDSYMNQMVWMMFGDQAGQ